MSFQLKGEVLNFKCIVWKFQIKTFEKLSSRLGILCNHHDRTGKRMRRGGAPAKFLVLWGDECSYERCNYQSVCCCILVNVF